MEQAIKKAIEGGYQGGKTTHGVKHGRTGPHGINLISSDTEFNIPETLLDPLFWQALGKAEGWGELTISRENWETEPKWLFQWHKFIDYLAEGKSADEFFNQLLK